jgi:hypothetical protein
MSAIEAKPTPEVGDEIPINTGLHPMIGPMWEQIGEVMPVWTNGKGQMGASGVKGQVSVSLLADVSGHGHIFSTN